MGFIDNFYRAGFLLFIFVLSTIAPLSAHEFKPFSSDLYERLAVKKEATEAEIKKAYKTAVKIFHPDRNPNGSEEFKRVDEAYLILNDSIKRKNYDDLIKRHSHSASAHSGNRDSQKTRDELKSLMKSHPHLAAFIEMVMIHDIGEKDENFRFLDVSKWPYLYPSDEPLIEGLIDTKHPNVLIHLASSLLNIPGWDHPLPYLFKIIDLNIERVNRFISGGLVHPKIINSIGLNIMDRLIEAGDLIEISRSIALGGHLHAESQDFEIPSWDLHPQILDYIEKIIFMADANQRKGIDPFLFNGEKSVWVKLLRTKKEYADLPYITSDQILRQMELLNFQPKTHCSTLLLPQK